MANIITNPCEDAVMVEVTREGKTSTFPSYVCGHCNDVVVMRAERTRERKRCLKCMRTICESKQICNQECIPLGEICRDHFEGPVAQKYKRYVPAIMAGIDNTNEAEAKGLVLL